jgi:hypothetical protein
LNVYLVYDTDHDADAAEQAANEAVGAIEKLFDEKCRNGRAWKSIELQSCEAVSDHAVTLRQSLSLREWRAEHLSLKASPQHPTLFR